MTPLTPSAAIRIGLGIIAAVLMLAVTWHLLVRWMRLRAVRRALRDVERRRGA